MVRCAAPAACAACRPAHYEWHALRYSRQDPRFQPTKGALHALCLKHRCAAGRWVAWIPPDAGDESWGTLMDAFYEQRLPQCTYAKIGVAPSEKKYVLYVGTANYTDLQDVRRSVLRHHGTVCLLGGTWRARTYHTVPVAADLLSRAAGPACARGRAGVRGVRAAARAGHGGGQLRLRLPDRGAAVHGPVCGAGERCPPPAPSAHPPARARTQAMDTPCLTRRRGGGEGGGGLE
jgi:hypothetical protein